MAAFAWSGCCPSTSSPGRRISSWWACFADRRNDQGFRRRDDRLGRETQGNQCETGRLTSVLTALPAVAQQVVREHDGHHRLTDRHGTDADTGVMTALGRDLRVFAAD